MASGQTVELSGGNLLSLGFTATESFDATVLGFGMDETINLSQLVETISSYSGGVLTLTGDQTVNLSLPGNFTKNSFVAVPDAGTKGTDIYLACFARGTRIATGHGEVAVECLCEGARVHSALGRSAMPIEWTGRRHVDCNRHPRPKSVWPVRISADTFDKGRPSRDLFLSPDHAVYIMDVLIPARLLVNGSIIVQVPVKEVDYYHVELSRHDVLLAEGLPAESYLDTGNRAAFENTGEPVAQHPDFASRVWEAEGCASLVVAGPKLAAARRWLNARAPAYLGPVRQPPRETGTLAIVSPISWLSNRASAW